VFEHPTKDAPVPAGRKGRGRGLFGWRHWLGVTPISGIERQGWPVAAVRPVPVGHAGRLRDRETRSVHAGCLPAPPPHPALRSVVNAGKRGVVVYAVPRLIVALVALFKVPPDKLPAVLRALADLFDIRRR
jgi:hypothetical protein